MGRISVKPSIEIFLCYDDKDEDLEQQLKKQLIPFQRQGIIELWDDSYIIGGVEWESEVNSHLDMAEMILLLVSRDFIASDRCYKRMLKAMARHDQREACVIPIIVRPVHWQETPFGKLASLPTQERSLVDPTWTLDEALYNVADGIWKAIERLMVDNVNLLHPGARKENDKALNELSKQPIYGYLACPNCQNTYFTGRQNLASPYVDVYNLIQCKKCGWRGRVISAGEDNAMKTQVIDYIDVEEKALALSCNIPDGLAILPSNFDTASSIEQLLHESTAPTIRSLWRQNGISEAKIEKEDIKLPQRSKKSSEWISPLIFVSQWMLTNAALPMTINMISSHLYEIIKGRHQRDAEITLEFVVESIEKTKKGEKREYKRITIKGSLEDIKNFDADKLKNLVEKSKDDDKR
jgi:hypothetical protein